MNRRDFLGLFRGLAVLPFVKLPELPEATEVLTDAEWGGICREWESAPGVPLPDDFLIDDAEPIRIGKLVSGSSKFTSGQAVCMSEYTGRLDVWKGHGQPIGIAARDIAPGETVEWRIGGNSKDIVTSGYTKIRVIDI